MNLFLRIILILIFFLKPLNAWSNSISKISVSKLGSNSDIIFTLDKTPKYKVFSLKTPHRLVIDFDNVLLKTSFNIAKNSIFKEFRHAKKNANGLRIVFTLNKKFKIIKSSILKSSNNKYRLVIKVSQDLSKIPAKKFSLSPLNSTIADKIINSNIEQKPKTLVKKPQLNKYVNKVRNKKKVIIIDAGHGGKDPGAIGRYARTKEKNVTLAFAREIKKYLDRNKNFKVYLTRSGDSFISLQGRVRKSQRLKADLFISVHADSAENRKATGLSIYTLSEKSSDKEAAKLAKKENKSDIIGGVNFSNTSGDILNTLIALSQRSTMNNSAKFAEYAIKKLKRGGINVKQNTHRFAGFRVLTAPDVPSVLIELGYLSNKSDEKKLNSPYYRRKFSKLMSDIVVGYFK